MSDNPAQDSRRRKARAKGIVVLFAMAIFAIWLAIDIARSSRRKREIADHIATLNESIDRWSETDLKVRLARGQIGKDKLFIWDFLRQCRATEDIPSFPTEHVITCHLGDEGFVICLPSGNHQLELTADWKLNPNSTPPVGEPNPKPGKKTWNIDLPGNSSYRLKMTSRREEGPVGWTISSSNSQFEMQEGQIPIDSFRASSWSFVGDNLAVYPNQIRRVLSTDKLKDAAADPPPVDIYDIELGGRVKDQVHSISIKGRLFTEANAAVDCGAAQSILARRQPDLLLPYKGNGKYELRKPDLSR